MSSNTAVAGDKAVEGRQVPISGRDEVQIPHANPQCFLYSVVLYMMTILFTALLAAVPSVFHNEKESPGGFFMIMTIASVSVAVTSSVILILTSYYLQPWMKDIHYTVLKSIGCLGAILAPFSLIGVLFVPHDVSWIVYSVIGVVCVGILVVYCFLWKYVCGHRQEKHSNDFPVPYSGFLIVLVPLSIVLQPFVHSNFLHRVRYPIICLSLSILVAVCCIAVMRFINRERNKYATWNIVK